MYRKFYPKLKWREASILNLSAEHKRIITTGGVTAWQDLAIYLIKRYCGARHALESTRLHLLSPHTDGQLPFASMTQSKQHNDALISDCQDWIAENYDCNNPVTRMCERSGLQARTFSRRFRAATGYHPLDYVQELRIEAAKQLLSGAATNIDEISYAVGYEDPTSFRRLFKRKAGITPAVYRKKFTGIAALKNA